MEKKSTKKKVVLKKVKATAEKVDPFAETVKPAAPKKASKKTAAPASAAKSEKVSKPAKKTRVLKSKPFEVVTDAFSEMATAPQLPTASKTRRKSVTTTRVSDEQLELVIPKRPRAARSKELLVEVLDLKTDTPVVEQQLEIVDVTAELAGKEPDVELSPVFKALADVKLPELPRENRARLQMQSPTMLYFYWGVKQNPWQQLKKVFGEDLGSYALVLKLTELNSGVEEMHPCDAEGNWWFRVEPDGRYRAEIGFYAPNRPYFRVIYSNTIETPRRSPSTRPASESRWTVSATKFAEVLDVSGFSRDAYDVAIAGDDPVAARDVTFEAFRQLMGGGDVSVDSLSAEDIRHALIAIAAGNSLEQLRFQVSAALFAVLQANADKLSAPSAQNTLIEHFEVDESEWTEYQTGSTVFGASLVNFPKTLKGRRVSPKMASRYNPISSFSLR